MNSRKQMKEITRNKITETALKLFSRKGINNVSTIEIAGSAGIAHGTIFIHFATKKELISEIVEKNLTDFEDGIILQVREANSFSELLDIILNGYEKYEEFFIFLVRDYFYFELNLKRRIMACKMRIISLLKQFIKLITEIEENQPIVEQYLIFGVIEFYLQHKDFFVDEGSIINRLKDQIKSLVKNSINHRLLNEKDDSLSTLQRTKAEGK
ncbi:MAG: TetR/AcrR family transcriptional regulator [Candidatus Cloacimonetes bacterium]|nr:TetR/AcrR family transcriptional regulator [Candidatus Cloacimonadota bacterium]